MKKNLPNNWDDFWDQKILPNNWEFFPKFGQFFGRKKILPNNWDIFLNLGEFPKFGRKSEIWADFRNLGDFPKPHGKAQNVGRTELSFKQVSCDICLRCAIKGSRAMSWKFRTRGYR